MDIPKDLARDSLGTHGSHHGIIITPNFPCIKKFVSYFIYFVGTNFNFHACKGVQKGHLDQFNIMNSFCFTLKDATLKWGEIFMQSHPSCTFELEAIFLQMI